MNRTKAILKIIGIMTLYIIFMALTAYLVFFVESFVYAAMDTMSIGEQLLLVLPAFVFIAVSWANSMKDFGEYLDNKFSVHKLIEIAKKKSINNKI